MDKFQTELLAQLKEHNRLTKELVKLQRASLELSKEINQVNSRLSEVIIPQNNRTELGTYCGVYPEIFSSVKVRHAHWINNTDKPSGYDINGHRTWYLPIMCSNCGFKTTAIEGHIEQYRYCPSCGMEMEKEGEKDEISN